MKKPWLSAILNFFFMGLGYIYNGKRIIPGVFLTMSAIGLTYIEQLHIFPNGTVLQEYDMNAFMILFACVFVANTGLAIDAYQEAKASNAG